MRKSFKFLPVLKICMALLLICAVLFGVFAAVAVDEAAGGFEPRSPGAAWDAALCDPRGGVLSVAHRGETTAHVPNTLDAVLAAADAGADLISVEATKTADNVFVLLTSSQKALINETQTLAQMQIALYGGSSSEKVLTLAETAETLAGRAGLIVDYEGDDLAVLCKYLRDNGLVDSILPRVTLPAKEILRFIEANPDLRLLGVYRGNVVMNANAFLKKLSAAGLPLVQYQNKNYFCVSFQKFTADRFSASGNGRALVNMTKPELCGLRDDSVTGWDDMISRGFSVIETGNINGFRAYLSQCNQCFAPLQTAVEQAKTKIIGDLSSQSAKALATAVAAGEKALQNNAALCARQSALSALQNAVFSAVPAGENETRKGALQITTGKVLTVLFFAVIVFAVQVYMHKMQEEGEKSYGKKQHR